MRVRQGRIVFVNRFFYPDISATSQILSDVAFALTKEGLPVTVLTSATLYERSGRLPRRETIDDVDVVRIATPAGQSKSLMLRGLAFFAFYILASFELLRLLRRGDVLVVKTDPPLFMVVAMLAARLRGVRQINWLQDLYPEVAAELGVGLARGRIGRMLAAMRDRALTGAAVNVVIGDRMAGILRERGVKSERIVTIPNWTDDDAIRPLGKPPAQRTDWGIADKFVIGYSGNLGKAHEIDTILQVASHYHNDNKVCFLFIGGGALRSALDKKGTDLELNNILWKPYQDRKDLPETLSVPDIHWLTLAPSLEGLIVPSKLYGIMAVGKPFIFVGSLNGEIAEVAHRYDCGRTVKPGDVGGFIATIEALRAEPDKMLKMGLRGRAALDNDFGRARAIHHWSILLREVSGRVMPVSARTGV